MQKVPQQISYALAKISFGIYLVTELRTHGGKEFPTETDVKKILQRINPACTAAELQTARQISRYCQTNRDYLRDGREETLDKVAKALNTPIKNFAAFREKINPMLKAFKYYSSYVEQAEQYLKVLEAENAGESKKKFCSLFACTEHSKVYLSMISYHFGEVNKDLPFVSFGAESDLRTERVIRDLFDAFDLPTPQYLPETLFFNQLNTQEGKAGFIAVGLFGNRLTEWLGNNGCLPPGLDILPAQKCIQLNNQKYYASREDGIDHALFCRLTLSNNNTVIVIGGIEGFGTQRLGEYLEQHWADIYEEAVSKPNGVMLFKTTNNGIKRVA